MAFVTNVFVNCPFDEDYRKFLEVNLFTIIYCGYDPLISETRDSGQSRLTGIVELIKQSKYGIHDLSRMTVDQEGDLVRFNMPFELGLELGVRNAENDLFSTKVSLVIDGGDNRDGYRYQKAISDIAGNDIERYSDLEALIRIVRNWLPQLGEVRKPGPKLIWEDFNEFLVDFQETLKEDGFRQSDINNLPRNEFIELAKNWIMARKEV